MSKAYTAKQLKAAKGWLTNFNTNIKDDGTKMSEAQGYPHYKAICQLIKDEHDLATWKDVNAFLTSGALPQSESDFMKQFA
jgi:hypothetical protein